MQMIYQTYTETDFCNEYNVIEPIWSTGAYINGSTTIAPSDIIWYNHPSIPEFQNTLTHDRIER